LRSGSYTSRGDERDWKLFPGCREEYPITTVFLEAQEGREGRTMDEAKRA